MDIREIRKILDMIHENDLAEFEIEDQGFRLRVKRRLPPETAAAAPAAAATAALPAAPLAAPAAAPVPAAAAANAEEAKWIPISAPIVGTFYRSPAPDAEAFVTIGQEVDENTVVCIIEAMKVMNDIKADCRGVVRKILVENATPVQYGQALFMVEPL